MKFSKYYIFIILLSLLAWYPTLGNWFFKGYEATWLESVTPHTFINLIRGHAFLYYLDLKLFGWHPFGWYLTSLVLHTFAAIIFFRLVLLLTKKKTLAFASSLFFVANTAYNDVLTWGSFNSYYPLLLIFMLISFIAFYKFKDTGKIKFFITSCIFAFLGFLTRETGIVIVPLITVYDLIFISKLNKKNVTDILKRQIPLYLLLAVFFVIRSWYGGISGDSADALVKMQMKFVKDGLYLQYGTLAFLTAGKLIAPQIIPYPFLNFIRDLIYSILRNLQFYTYFFSVAGWILFGLVCLLISKFRKTKYFKLFVFFTIWVLAFSFFVALAVPNDANSLMAAYDWNTMRYRYFAFIGTSAVFSIFAYALYEKLKSQRSKRIVILSFIGIILINLLLIWKIEFNVYQTAFKPDKDFYSEFEKSFPTLPKNPVFYLYPLTSGLNDYMLEFYYISGSDYPQFKNGPYRVESQIIAILDKIKKGKISLPQVLFLDYSRGKGLINDTQKVRDIIKESKKYPVSLSKINNHVFRSNTFVGPHTEFPYNLNYTLNSSLTNQFIGSKPDSAIFKALVDYNLDRDNYLKSVSIKTAYTASQRPGEPFFHDLPSHLIDGNIGPRSKWIADTFTPWVIADLGKIENVVAVDWGSLPGPRVPATYSIFASDDGKNWTKIKKVKDSTKTEAIDAFDKPVKARYIKMEIYTTSGGDFVLMDEFDVIGSDASSILSYYTDRDKLFNDANNMFKYISSSDDLNYMQNRGLNTYWGKLTWETNKTSSVLNYQQLYFQYQVNSANQAISIEIPEGEIYSGEGDFLKKNITSIQFDFGESPINIDVNSAVFIPKYQF